MDSSHPQSRDRGVRRPINSLLQVDLLLKLGLQPVILCCVYECMYVAKVFMNPATYRDIHEGEHTHRNDNINLMHVVKFFVSLVFYRDTREHTLEKTCISVLIHNYYTFQVVVTRIISVIHNYKCMNTFKVMLICTCTPITCSHILNSYTTCTCTIKINLFNTKITTTEQVINTPLVR